MNISTGIFERISLIKVGVADFIYDVVGPERSGLEVRLQRRSLFKDRTIPTASRTLPRRRGFHGAITILRFQK